MGLDLSNDRKAVESLAVLLWRFVRRRLTLDVPSAAPEPSRPTTP